MSTIAHVGDYVIASSRRPRRFAIGVVRELVVFTGRWYRIGPENPNEEAFPWIYPNVRHITHAHGRRLCRAARKRRATPMFHQIWQHLIEEHKRTKKPSSFPSKPSFLKHLNEAIRGQNIDPTEPGGTSEPADPAVPWCSVTATAPGADSAAESPNSTRTTNPTS